MTQNPPRVLLSDEAEESISLEFPFGDGHLEHSPDNTYLPIDGGSLGPFGKTVSDKRVGVRTGYLFQLPIPQKLSKPSHTRGGVGSKLFSFFFWCPLRYTAEHR